MSTLAFVGTVVGAFLAAFVLASLSFWLGLLSVIVGTGVLVLAWKELSGMRRVACSVALVWFVFCWFGYLGENKRITAVKNMACPADKRHSIGQVLDAVCTRPDWNCFESREEDGKHIIEFRGKTKKGVVLLQFGVRGSEPIGGLPYAEWDGKQMSAFEIASFFSNAYAEYAKKRGQ
jgi:hypothetical protein